jgi:hypothetical protein
LARFRPVWFYWCETIGDSPAPLPKKWKLVEKHDPAYPASKINELRGGLTSLADGSGLENFITIIHELGFTSVAETFFSRRSWIDA